MSEDLSRYGVSVVPVSPATEDRSLAEVLARPRHFPGEQRSDSHRIEAERVIKTLGVSVNRLIAELNAQLSTVDDSSRAEAVRALICELEKRLSDADCDSAAEALERRQAYGSR